MNTPLLLRVKERILAEPEHFWMGDWINMDCGTSGCIAGHAIMEALSADAKTAREIVLSLEYKHSIFSRLAASALDLTKDQSERLFYACAWPEPFRCNPTAEVSAKRIEHFIATEGRE